MSDWNAIAARARSLLEQPGLTVTLLIGMQEYRGVRTTLRREDVNSDAGLIEGRYVFSVLVDASTLPPDGVPPRRTIVLIDGAKYRVLSTETDAVGAIVRINLGDTNA